MAKLSVNLFAKRNEAQIDEVGRGKPLMNANKLAVRFREKLQHYLENCGRSRLARVYVS